MWYKVQKSEKIWRTYFEILRKKLQIYRTKNDASNQSEYDFNLIENKPCSGSMGV